MADAAVMPPKTAREAILEAIVADADEHGVPIAQVAPLIKQVDKTYRALDELADLVDGIKPFQETLGDLRAVLLKANQLVNIHRGRV